jgi:hypothetical protein
MRRTNERSRLTVLVLTCFTHTLPLSRFTLTGCRRHAINDVSVPSCLWCRSRSPRNDCEDIETKRLRLSERVFIPEKFSLERAAEIAQRHKEALSIRLSPESDLQFKMIVAVAELKEFRQTTLGYEVVLKHSRPISAVRITSPYRSTTLTILIFTLAPTSSLSMRGRWDVRRCASFRVPDQAERFFRNRSAVVHVLPLAYRGARRLSPSTGRRGASP